MLCLVSTTLLAAIDQTAPASCRQWIEEDSARKDLVFGTISITTNDVFNPDISGEEKWYHKLGNRLHTRTRPAVIHNQILFKPGDPYSSGIVRQSERLLRRNRFIRSATIVPTALCGNQVNVAVTTEDHWTLTPSVAYREAGGVSSWKIEAQELNLLGLGKSIKFSYETSDRDTETLFQYRDRNLLGTRYVLGLDQQTLNGAQSWRIALGLPFFSEQSTMAWGIVVEDTRRLSRRVLVDDRRAKSKASLLDVYYRRKLARDDAIYRVGAGWRIEQEDYTVDRVDVAATEPFEFEYVYPYLSFQYLLPDFVTRENVFSIGRVEDISTGFSFTAEAGAITQGLGNDDDLLRLALSINKGWDFGGRSIGSIRTRLIDYVGTGRYSAAVRLAAVYKLDDKNLFQFNANVRRLSGFSPDHYLPLGGESGLKGYPDEYQRGDHRILGAAEFRHILDWYPLRLFRVAISGFYEVGSAWTSGESRDLLHNVGLGLAVSPTRTSTYDLFRFDIAMPITDREDLKSYQFYIGTQIRY